MWCGTGSKLWYRLTVEVTCRLLLTEGGRPMTSSVECGRAHKRLWYHRRAMLNVAEEPTRSFGTIRGCGRAHKWLCYHTVVAQPRLGSVVPQHSSYTPKYQSWAYKRLIERMNKQAHWNIKPELSFKPEIKHSAVQRAPVESLPEIYEENKNSRS